MPKLIACLFDLAVHLGRFAEVCIPLNHVPTAWAYFVPEAVFDGTLVALVLLKIVGLYISERRQTPRLMVV